MEHTSPLPKSILSLLPQDKTSQAILTHTQLSLKPPIFNHSLRVYLLATKLHEQETTAHSQFTHPSGTTTILTFNPATLFAASMFHDMGTHPSANGPHRFELEGADAAVTYLHAHGTTSSDDLHAIWCAIALHTSVGIAERIDPFTRLIRMGVKADFSPSIRDGLGLTNWAAEIESWLPRLDVEQCLAEAVVDQATRGEKEQGLYVGGGGGKWADSQKFPKASWPGVLLRGHLERVRDEGEGWKGSNPAF